MNDTTALVIDGFSGEVITRDSPGFDQARTLWNAMIDRRPELILLPRGVADVVAALRYAASRSPTPSPS
jgi:hypothetical protein